MALEAQGVSHTSDRGIVIGARVRGGAGDAIRVGGEDGDPLIEELAALIGATRQETSFRGSVMFPRPPKGLFRPGVAGKVKEAGFGADAHGGRYRTVRPVVT